MSPFPPHEDLDCCLSSLTREWHTVHNKNREMFIMKCYENVSSVMLKVKSLLLWLRYSPIPWESSSGTIALHDRPRCRPTSRKQNGVRSEHLRPQNQTSRTHRWISSVTLWHTRSTLQCSSSSPRSGWQLEVEVETFSEQGEEEVHLPLDGESPPFHETEGWST